MKHTKGPWELATMSGTDLPAIIGGKPGPIIAEITKWTSVGQSDPDTIQANARLIAAAPELLEALRDLLYAATLPMKERREGWDSARALIKKVAGE